MTTQPIPAQMTFDAELARKAKESGMSRALITNYQERHKLLEWARSYASSYARIHGKVTSDDVRKGFMDMGLNWNELGNAAGSIFRGNQWECVGSRASEVVSRHGNFVRIWRLK